MLMDVWLFHDDYFVELLIITLCYYVVGAVINSIQFQMTNTAMYRLSKCQYEGQYFKG